VKVSWQCAHDVAHNFMQLGVNPTQAEVCIEPDDALHESVDVV